MVDIAVSGTTVYGIDATGTLSKGSLTSITQNTASWVAMANAPALSDVSAGGGRVCGVKKADKKIVCSTDGATWTQLPGANWVHVAAFGNKVYATDSNNALKSYTFA
ncbi:hypothetical protein SDRG_03991 [Saprolegnia diclina VS20]|uniref:Photosynthesis system II assembly factor Ycf48/Hcf136-like domain-containing protein n=1 Tax=Saprolegnia diclina (strain VS20) TaxID=1156394 RepID=T0QLW3_SAPDV|nr:hypothetical protein SDRG_03991 [Saprolegnia diclina VS20]EQC39039.1 hypothetical protein SDRG_03991 [Saprolegnia diclina VS20]|eukprot:XP_008607863.1 hypothetical protein SDRG_03991 [Saprolegnia diclina VS20]